MIGLLIIGLFAIYVLMSVLLIRYVSKKAKKVGLNSTFCSAACIFFIYNLLFWEWVPSLYVYHDRCTHLTSIKIHKNAAQWMLEQGMTAEELKVSDAHRREVSKYNLGADKGYSMSPLNERLDSISYMSNEWFGVTKVNNKVVDRKTGEALFENTSFLRSPSSGGISKYQFWMYSDTCYGPNEESKTLVLKMMNEYQNKDNNYAY